MSYGSPEQDPSQNKNRQLHICPSCNGELVRPTWWERAGRPNFWKVGLRCPDCEHTEEGVFSEGEIDLFDEKLDKGAHELSDELRGLEHENMRELAGSFAIALEQDLIGPDDFARPVQ